VIGVMKSDFGSKTHEKSERCLTQKFFYYFSGPLLLADNALISTSQGRIRPEPFSAHLVGITLVIRIIRHVKVAPSDLFYLSTIHALRKESHPHV
jgi:hypothetical protein